MLVGLLGGGNRIGLLLALWVDRLVSEHGEQNVAISIYNCISNLIIS